MADKLDYKKEYKDLYMPGGKPSVIQVPPIAFVMVDGKGAPESSAYQDAMSLLYSISFTIKMSKMKGPGLPGYFEYVVPPLEGFWGGDTMWDQQNRDSWVWTSLIRLPEFVTPEIFAWAKTQAAAKNPQLDYTLARYEVFEEGLCVQMMHTGPYSTEPASIQQMYTFMDAQNLAPDYSALRRHHEIYLGDPRKTKPEKLRTVLRLPARQKGGAAHATY